jgi:hypothetical protein
VEATMMRVKKVLMGATVLLIASAAWAGGDVWKTKPFSQWDDADVRTILQSSPWAKPGQQVQGSWRPADTAPADTSNLTVAGTKADNSNRSNGPTTSQPGGTQNQATAQDSQQGQAYNVFWWSSRTIREANLRSQVLKGTATQDAADNTMKQPGPDAYQILVAGRNMAIFQQRGEDAMMKAAFLQAHKNKQKEAATKVDFQKDAAGSVVAAIFSFPKTTASGGALVGPDEKDVEFQLQIGGNWLRTSFNTKQMVDGQGEDL